MGGGSDSTDANAFWDGVHAGRPEAAEPRVNVRLVETVDALPPGDALDLGCGGGGDTLWLARQGWRVTAVDISAVAAGRVAGPARTQGLRPPTWPTTGPRVRTAPVPCVRCPRWSGRTDGG